MWPLLKTYKKKVEIFKQVVELMRWWDIVVNNSAFSIVTRSLNEITTFSGVLPYICLVGYVRQRPLLSRTAQNIQARVQPSCRAPTVYSDLDSGLTTPASIYLLKQRQQW